MPHERPTIQQALDAAQAGDTVQVDAGTYAENLRITKSLVLRAAPGAQAVVVGKPGRWVIQVDRAPRVAVEGLTVQGGEIGIGAIGSEALRLVGNTISGFSHWGIGIAWSTGTIERNHVSCAREAGAKATPQGIAIGDESEISVLANTIDGAPALGLLIDRSSVALVIENRISGAQLVEGTYGVGFVARRGSRVTLERNVISDNQGGGVELLGASARLSGNKLLANGDRGLLVTARSEASSVEDEVRGTLALQSGRGFGVVVAQRSQLQMMAPVVVGSERVGILAVEESTLELTRARVDSNAYGGIAVEDGSLGEIFQSQAAANKRVGVNVYDRGRVRIDETRLLNTVESGGFALGISVQVKSRADVTNSVVSGNAQFGVAAYESSCVEVSDSRITDNNVRGVEVEGGSRVLLQRNTVSGHGEAAVGAFEGSELALFGNEIVGNKGTALLLDGGAKAMGAENRVSGNGDDQVELAAADAASFTRCE